MGNRRLWIWIGVGAVVVLALFSATAIATDSSKFCPTCHEMVPHYDAWTVGPHKDVPCIECHVNRGLPSRFAHKFVALGEVWSHFTGGTSFPKAAPAVVPDARCIACHETVVTPELPKNFDHAKHSEEKPCQLCHATVGHDVTDQQLKDAGVFDAATAAANASSPTSETVAVPGQGSANLAGHKEVVCSECHDMEMTGCPACHHPPAQKHPFTTDCLSCHKPGARFVFSHPDRQDCSECHKPPTEDGHPANDDCAQCHRGTGESWAFSHPEGEDCAQCHKRPGGSHPTSSNCTSCHKQVGRSWSFAHPTGGDCTGCHKAPGGKHPTSNNCASCHPNAGGSWAFRHRGNTGEHSYRSFACAKCHPTSYDRATCTCHKNGVPKD